MAPQTDQVDVRARLVEAAVSSKAAASVAAASTENAIELATDLQTLSLHLDLERIEPALNLCLAYWCLPSDRRLARESQFDAVMADEFGDALDTGVAEVNALIRRARSFGRVTSDACLVLAARDHAFGIHRLLWSSLNDKAEVERFYRKVRPEALQLQSYLQRRRFEIASDDCERLVQAALPFGADLQRYVDAVICWIEHSPAAIDALIRLARHFDSVACELGTVFSLYDRLRDAVLACANPAAAVSSEAAVSRMLIEAVEQAECSVRAGCYASWKAFVSGQANLGSHAHKLASQALRWSRLQLATVATVMRRSYAEQAATLGQPALRMQQEAVSGWCLNQLVCWIEGPVATSAAPGNPATIASRYNARKKAAAVGLCPHPLGVAALPNPLEEADIGAAEVRAIMQEGYRSAADFFIDELQQANRLANTKGAGFDTGAARRVVVELASLRDAAQGMEETPARVLFQQAEAMLASLRREIGEGKGNHAAIDDLVLQLRAAVSRERLTLGRLRGAAVTCRGFEPSAQWRGLCEALHDRLLPTWHIDEAGLTRPLAENEALAWHVGFGSSFGSSFDVAIHLWRRRPGSHREPTPDGGMVMDPEAWYDTLVSCAVLRVHAGPEPVAGARGPASDRAAVPDALQA